MDFTGLVFLCLLISLLPSLNVFLFLIRVVGFLRYFQVKQLHHFLLASPILSVAVCSIIWYASSLPKVFQSLMEGRIFVSMLYPVGDNPNLESTSESKCRISSKPLEGTFALTFSNISCHEMRVYYVFPHQSTYIELAKVSMISLLREIVKF